MKKIIFTAVPPPKRKLVAVIGNNGLGLWVQASDGVCYLNSECRITPRSESYSTLEECLNGTGQRKPVYEGDSLTITF